MNSKVDEISDDEFDEILAQKRHKELTKALSSLTVAISSIKPSDDKSIVNAINSQPAIFKQAMEQVVKSIPREEIPQVNIADDYKKIVSLFAEMINQAVKKIEESNEKVIFALENRMLPDSFDLVKTFGGITDSVKVNYKKSNQITNKS